MQYWRTILSLTILALLAANSVSGGESARTAADSPPRHVPSKASEAGQPAAGLDALDRAALSPIDREISDYLLLEKESLLRLDAQFQAATDALSALSIQKQIREIKQGTELGILGIQARHARLEGQFELAQRIEATLEKMKNPPAPAQTSGGSDEARQR